MKPWIKGGIIVAIAYTLLNLLFVFWGMACGYNTNPYDTVCPVVDWIYRHLFFLDKGFDLLLPHPINQNVGLVLFIVLDCIIGFILGAAATEAFRRLRKKA